MSTLISRLYSWATDKTNSVKITASRMDAENNQIITALNRKVLCAASAPDSPIAGQSWYDTTNKILKLYRDNEWVALGGLHVAATAPSNPIEGDLWYETDTDLLKAYNGSAWVEFLISIAGATEKTTLVADDLFLIEDSEATNAKKKVKQSNINIAGAVVQVVNTQTSTYASIGSTSIPNDDTVPTWAEGNEVSGLQTTITPKSATNILVFEVKALLSHTGSDTTTFLAMYSSPTGTDPAIAISGAETTDVFIRVVPLTFKMVAGTTNALTFKFRAGDTAGNANFFNGTSSGTTRKFGGIAYSSVTITEIKA